MAWNVTTEWDDIHRKLGNYEPLPVVKPQSEHTKENIAEIERIAEEKVPTDSDDDEQFFEEYRRKKLEEAAMVSVKETVFRGVNEIDATDYVQQVNNAGSGVSVILNFYQSHVEPTVLINNALSELSVKYPQVKFLKTVSTRCVNNFDDRNLPYLLYYRDGVLKTQVQKEQLLSYRRISPDSIEYLLFQIGVPELSKLKSKKESVRDFISDKLGRKRITKEDFSSDEEEREDKQFISNKAFIRY